MRKNKQILVTIAAVMIAATTIFAGCKKDDVKVTGVKVCPTAVMLEVGNSTTLLKRIEPSNADDLSVIWTSDKSDVATVTENGVVTAFKTGEATITCTTKDGGHTATMTVIVNPARNDDDYATLIPSFYFGEMMMGEENVGSNKLITVKYHAENEITFSIDEKFIVAQMGTEVPMKVDCNATVTKNENRYNATGSTTANLMGLSLPVTIEAVFGGNTLDMNINVKNVPMMGEISISFGGKGIMEIEPCAIID